MANQLSNAQVDAINHLLQGMSGIKKTVVQHSTKELNNILRQGEMPDRMLVVLRGWADAETLLVVTDSRVIFVSEKLGFSTTPQLRVEDFPLDEVSSVEYKPGMAKHEILFRANGKRQSFNLRWWDGKFPARQIAEYLHDRVSSNKSQPSAPQHLPGKSPFAKDDKEAKAFAIEDAVRKLNDLDGGDRILQVGGELKKLPEILEDGELPERLLPATYDERRGLQVSKFNNRQGLLVATDSRLIFVDKDRTGLTVHDFDYDSISYAEVSTGMISGKLTIHVSGIQEVFEGDSYRIQRMGKHISDKISPHAVAPVQHPKTRTSVLDETLLKLGCTQETRDAIRISQLPEALENALEHGDLPEKMTLCTHNGWHGLLFCTTSCLIFVWQENAAPPGGNAIPETLSFPFSEIESVESSTGMFFGKIIIGLSGGKEIFDGSTNGVVREFESHIRAKISASSPSPAPSNPPSMPPVARHISVADELEKLHGLVVKGVLTQEEFEAEKKKLLGG